MPVVRESHYPTIDSLADTDWLKKAIASVNAVGYACVSGVLDDARLDQIRAAMYRVQGRILAVVGEERLRRAGELGVLRLMCKYDPTFLELLEVPQVLAIVDATVSPTAILHLQNGFILPSFEGDAPSVFQNRFHTDFPRVLNGFLASINVMFAIDEFREDNGATLVLAGTHQRHDVDVESLRRAAHPATCEAGSILIFDSTLWHAAGANTSGADRLAINHQFTRSWIKQQIDYVRALGPDVVEAQKPRTQQLLGWYTRVVTSLDDYYQPSEMRLYRSGQG